MSLTARSGGGGGSRFPLPPASTAPNTARRLSTSVAGNNSSQQPPPLSGSYASASSSSRRRSSITQQHLPQMTQEDSTMKNEDDDDGDGDQERDQCLSPSDEGDASSRGSSRPRIGSSSSSGLVSPEVGVFNDINGRYSMEDVTQCRELYEALRETGALKGCWRGMPNALDILGTADQMSSPASQSLQKSNSLRALIKKHGIGQQDKSKMSALPFQQLVQMLCVPIREKRYIERRRASRSVNFASSVGAGGGIGGTGSVGGGAFDEAGTKSFGHFEREHDSRSTSPDLFGIDIRGGTPESPSSALLAQDEQVKQQQQRAEPSPEKLLQKLKNVTEAQKERSQRAKRIVRLTRKELYAACDITDVSAYRAGYDEQTGRLRDFAEEGRRNKTNFVHPLLVDEQVKAARDAEVRSMARPRGIRPAAFHGAAARTIGSLQPEPELFDSNTMSASAAAVGCGPTPPSSARNRHRPPISPRSNGPTTTSARTQAHRPATARSPHDHRSRPRPQSSASDVSSTPWKDSSDSDSDGDDEAQEDDRDAQTMAASAGTSARSKKTDPYRETVRSGRLHVLIDKPDSARTGASAGKGPVVHNLSARVKMREVERQIEDERNDLGGYATSRSMAHRLRKVQEGEKINMFDSVEDKILSRWIQ